LNLRFADFEIDVARRELRRAGAIVHLEPQVFDLLVHLVRNRDRIVSKDELIDAIWQGRIVSEAALSSRVSAARRALGDSGNDQTLIRTLHKHGFRFVGDVDEDGPAPAAANMSRDPDQEYFADGLTEDIITGLSRQRWFFVIARNSSFTYKGRAVDIRQVGRDLGVRYVLEGSVRRIGNKVRITGQLSDAMTGTDLWAERFEGTLDDIFELQDQMAGSVVGAIAPQLERAEIERAKRKPTESLDAYD
jgi:TolB-like protein